MKQAFERADERVKDYADSKVDALEINLQAQIDALEARVEALE